MHLSGIVVMQQNGLDNVAIIHVHLTSVRLYVKVGTSSASRSRKGSFSPYNLLPDADLAVHDMALVTITSSNSSPRSTAIEIDDGAVGFSAKDGSGPSELA